MKLKEDAVKLQGPLLNEGGYTGSRASRLHNLKVKRALSMKAVRWAGLCDGDSPAMTR